MGFLLGSRLAHLTLLSSPRLCTAYDDFLKCEVPKVLLDLLFMYEWNNFVHHLVEEVVRIIVDSTSTELKANVRFSLSILFAASWLKALRPHTHSCLRAPS